jgi:hypothetical protein
MIARTLVLQGIILIALSISGGSSGAVSGGGRNNPAPISVASVIVSPTSPFVTVAGTAQFTATAKDSNGNAVNSASFTWSSSNTATATISSTGLATGVAAGTTNIAATAGGVTSAPVTLTVTVPTPTLKFSGLTLPSAVDGQGYTNTVTASRGTQPYSYSITEGSLPVGMSGSSSNNSFVISGVPNDQAGNFVFSVEVMDSSSPVQSQSASFTLPLAAATPPPPAANIQGQWEFNLDNTFGPGSPNPVLWGNFAVEQQNSALSSGSANLACTESATAPIVTTSGCTSWICNSGYSLALNGSLTRTNLYIIIGCAGAGGTVTNPPITLMGTINAGGTTASGTITGGSGTGGTWSAFLVPSISGSYVATTGTVTATLTENTDFTVTGTVDGMNFTQGSLVGGYVSMANTAGCGFAAEVDSQGDLQGQIGGSGCSSVTFTLNPSQ